MRCRRPSAGALPAAQVPLITGAQLVIAPWAMIYDGLAMMKRLSQVRPTVMQATPATWRMLVDSGWHGADIVALCGGEALPIDLARRLLSCGVELWNMYGPTETTIWSSVAQIRPDPDWIDIGHDQNGSRDSNESKTVRARLCTCAKICPPAAASSRCSTSRAAKGRT